MGAYHYSYPVKLQSEQRKFLETMVHTNRTPTKHYVVARVLLMSDQREGAPNNTDGQIAEALSISRRTVIRIKQRFVQGSLEVALTGSFPRERPERRCLDGKGEAQLIHLACSEAPDGRQRWTLELLADQMVKLEYVEHISPETVRKTLKKTTAAILAEAMMFQSMPRNLNAGEDCLRIFQQVGGATTAFILTARFQSVFLDEFIRRDQVSVLPFS